MSSAPSAATPPAAETMPLWAWVLVEMDDPRADAELRTRLARQGVRRSPARLQDAAPRAVAAQG